MKNGLNEESRTILQNLGDVRVMADRSGQTLLHYSSRYGNAEMTQYLLDQGCNVNVQVKSELTPLMLAIKNKNFTTTEILLKSNADVLVFERINGTCMFEKIVELAFCTHRDSMHNYSSKRNSYYILTILFDIINEAFSKNDSALKEYLLESSECMKLIFVVFGSVDLINFMLDNDYPIDYYEPVWNYTALHCAVLSSRFDSAKMLIERGADVDALTVMNNSVLHYYTLNFEKVDDKSRVLMSLLKKSTRLSMCEGIAGYTCIEHLLMRGKKKTVKTILQSGIDFNSCLKNNRSILSRLVLNDNIGVLDALVELDVNFNTNESRPPYLDTFLESSVLRQRPRVVEFLLEHGANVKLNTVTGTALSKATTRCEITSEEDERNVTKMTELLLQYGADAQCFVYQKITLIDVLSAFFENELATKIVVAHLAMLGAVDQPTLHDTTRNTIELGALKSHFDSCTQQLVELKNLRLHDSAVTMFMLLTERDDKIVSYARNSEFISAYNNAMMSMHNLEPYYFNSLERRVSKALDKLKLLENSSLAIEKLTNICADVYHVIVYKIINYLDRRDLNNLCKIDIVILQDE